MALRDGRPQLGGVATTGRLLLLAAAILAVTGLTLLALSRFGRIGRLPLDLRFERGPVTIYVPLGTAILLSLIATLLINLYLRLRR